MTTHSATVLKHRPPARAIPHRPPSTTAPAATAQAVIDTLNALIETCADGAYGFASCGDYSNISRHRSLFRQRAHACDEVGSQLQTVVLKLGGVPARGGSTSGALHRGWVAVRGTLSGLRDQSILAECERGELVALERYRNALAQALPSDVRRLVQSQCDGIAFNLEQIRLLREAERALA